MDLSTWQTIVAFFVSVASLVAALAVINSKFVAPYLAKPIAKAVKNELTEFVEVAFVGSEVLHEHIKETTEEIVGREMKVLITMMRNHEARLEAIERNTAYVKNRMEERPARD